MDDFVKVKAKRYQILLTLVWALTVDKAHGIALDAVKATVLGILATGYLYIALSRVGYHEVIEVVGFCKSKIIALLQCVKRVFDLPFSLRQ